MKTHITIAFLITFIFSVFVSGAQEAATLSSGIAGAIRSGNAKDLATYFHPNIELIVLENDGTYSKSQAEMILKDFFSKNPPKEFSIDHNGSSKDMSTYYIGSYKTSGQKTYRVYFLLKKMGEKLLIQQLQIQE